MHRIRESDTMSERIPAFRYLGGLLSHIPLPLPVNCVVRMNSEAVSRYRSHFLVLRSCWTVRNTANFSRVN
jgi:hypothetical protein